MELSTRSSTPPRQQLSRDQRLEIRTLRDIGWTYKDIAARMKVTERAVQTACTVGATPQKRSGRPGLLTPDQNTQLIEFVCASQKNRLMPYHQIPQTLGWDVSESVIRRALKAEGFARHPTYSKPPISEKNRQIRLSWAMSHVGWEWEDWHRILWTDETWVTGGKHKRMWVTRRANEELDQTCIIEKEPRPKGWMFWGCFAGTTGKGPCLFWEKEWGTINKETYCAHTVPLIDGWIRMHAEERLVLMQDGAPGHSAEYTIDELKSRGVTPMFWPPYSPDLNPIETIWGWMKDYIQKHYPLKMSYDQLRVAVRAAWDSIPEYRFRELLETMPARCEAVIAAEGRHTKY